MICSIVGIFGQLGQREMGSVLCSRLIYSSSAEILRNNVITEFSKEIITKS